MQDVKSLIEKSFSFGIGLAAWSREKIEDMVEEMVRKGEISQKEARAFAGDLVKKGEAQREELNKMVASEVEKTLERLNVAKKSDVVDKDTLAQIVREQVDAALRERDRDTGA